MSVDSTSVVLAIAFFLIYAIFLLYELFNREGEAKYGNYGYFIAILPANFLWVVSEDYALAMVILCLLWIALVIRDIYLKQQKEGDDGEINKDADDIAMFLVFSIVINSIVSSVVPDRLDNPDGLETFWKYFNRPDLAYEGYSGSIVLAYQLLLTILIFMVMIPIIMDLKGEQTNLTANLIVSLIFIIPFWYVIDVWVTSGDAGLIGSMIFLMWILFFMLLLGITRGKGDKQ